MTSALYTGSAQERKLVKSPARCQQHKETVDDVIYNSKRYDDDEERKELISYLNKKGKVNRDLEYLLG